MAVETYSELVTFLTDHLELDSETVTNIPSFVRLAEAELDRVLTNHQRETTASLDFEATETFKAFATTMRQIRHVQLADGTRLDPVTPNVLANVVEADPTGKPVYYSIANQKLYLAPVPDTAYTVTLFIQEAIPAISTSNQSNWLITYHPDAYVYSTIVQILAWQENDERIPLYRAALENVINQINRQGLRYRSAAPMRLRSSVVV